MESWGDVMHSKRVYAKIIVNLLLTIICIPLVLFLGPKLLAFFSPFVVAYIISMIANPLVRFMERRVKIVRRHSSAIIIIVVLAAIFGLIYLCGIFLVRQFSALYEDIPNIAKSLTELLDEISVRFSNTFVMLPDGMKTVITNLGANVENYLSKYLDGIEMPSILEISNYVKDVANILFIIIITILATYFFIAERDRMAEVSNRIFPESIKKGYKLIVDNFKNAVGGYFKAQFKIMILLLFIMFVAFELMDVNFSFLLALGIAFLDFLPIFGTGAVFWPWAVVDLISGNYLRAVFIVILYLVCLLVKQLLQPKMVGDSIGVSPLLALVFMFIGYRLGGVIGMIIGIPIGLMLVNFYRLGMFDRIIRGIKIIISDINEFRKY